MNLKIDAILVTAVLCTVQTGKNTYFRFCIPSGGKIDYDEMEAIAMENGVTEVQWLCLLEQIDRSLNTLQ